MSIKLLKAFLDRNMPSSARYHPCKAIRIYNRHKQAIDQALAQAERDYQMSLPAYRRLPQYR